MRGERSKIKINKCNEKYLLKYKEISKEKNPSPANFSLFHQSNYKSRYHAVLILTSFIFPVSRYPVSQLILLTDKSKIFPVFSKF